MGDHGFQDRFVVSGDEGVEIPYISASAESVPHLPPFVTEIQESQSEIRIQGVCGPTVRGSGAHLVLLSAPVYGALGWSAYGWYREGDRYPILIEWVDSDPFPRSQWKSLMLKRRRYIPLFALLGLLVPWGLSGQIQPSVGGWAGVTSSRHLRDDGLATDWKGGVALGGYLDTATPLSLFFVRVQLGYHQRGSKVSDTGVGSLNPTESKVVSHYVGAQLHGRLKLMAGPVGVFVFGGPSMDQLVKTGCTEDFCRALGEEMPTVWGLTGGGGVEVELPAGGKASFEYRWEEGLSVAYQNDVTEVRNRTRGLMVSLGFPFNAGSP
jgi:hypothetical protein